MKEPEVSLGQLGIQPLQGMKPLVQRKVPRQNELRLPAEEDGHVPHRRLSLWAPALGTNG